ncbi:beta-1,4-galactosyltransferase 2-like [Cydia fagiglandana]|uniref:beta-1,4-galactosyltransferase 2-like n=1 Tax=Cydia fagiglandana TaxID=1458189 RepID=UPI002FEE63DA
MQYLCHICRCLQKKLIKIILFIILLLVSIDFFRVYGCFNYLHISEDAIDSVLYKAVNPNMLNKDRPNCTYNQVLKSKESIHAWDVRRNYDDFDAEGIADGEYSPKHCSPLFSVAILVTYRNRQNHLDIFFPYMHNFLRKQNIHYKIYLIEQQDGNPFNKGLLYNVGARKALTDGFPCLILHDIDLLPLDTSNLYACSTDPRHFSASIDQFRFVLLYDWLIGGVLSIRIDQYVELNGFSNRFLKWGAEDDDFYMRMAEQNIKVIRFPPSMSRYTMLHHPQAEMNGDRRKLLVTNRNDTPAVRKQDGLRGAHAHVRKVNQRLFTHVIVQT